MATKLVTIEDFSDFVVRYFEAAKQAPISNLMLQKIMYYIQSYHLVYFEKHPLFEDQPEAWVRGPVYRTVYNTYRHFGASKILLASDDKGVEYQKSLDKLELSEKQSGFIMAALDFFGNQTAGELVIRSHGEKPWNDAREGVSSLDYCDNKITHDMMYNYYTEKVASKAKKSE